MIGSINQSLGHPMVLMKKESSEQPELSKEGGGGEEKKKSISLTWFQSHSLSHGDPESPLSDASVRIHPVNSAGQHCEI